MHRVYELFVARPLKMSHCLWAHSHVTQMQFLLDVVRLCLCYEPGLGHLGHWGQEDVCREEDQEEERLRQEERPFVMS